MSLLKPKITVTVTNRTVVRVTLVVIASLLALKLVSELAHVLTLIGISFFLAMALNPAVSWIARKLKSNSRARATGLAYVAVMSVLIAFFSLIVPPLVKQTSDFISDVPETIDNFKTQDSAVARFARKYKLDEQLSELSQDLSSQAPKLRSQLFSTATRIGSTIISIVTVFVLTFMMLVEGPMWFERFLGVLAADRREHARKIARKMYRVVTSYVNGQLLIALIGAGFSLVALFIASTALNVSVNVIALAGIVALGGLIPMVGNSIAAALVAIVCLFTSAPLAIIMAIYFLIYQQIENVTIQPYIQSRQNELTPLLVFLAALIGIGFGGLLGGLIAIPVAGCIKVLVEDYFSRKKLAPETVE